MGRKKKALGQMWAFKNKQREEKEAKEEDKISPEAHEERVKKLRELGLIK